MDVLQTLVPAVGWALLHFIWQGLLIGWGVALAMHLLRRARPHTRYAVACAGLLLCAALPLASIVTQLHADSGSAASSSAGASLGAVSLIPAFVVDTGATVARTPLLGADALAGWESVLRHQLPWVVGLWLAGAALMSLRLAIGLKWVAERTRSDHYTVNHYWQRRLSDLARRAGLDFHVRLGVAEGLDSPITAGCWRPIVLVPASLITGMPPELLEALLAHELAHIKRRDYLVNLIQSAVEIVLFYHPSVWALSRRIRIEREQIADDTAVAMLGQPQMLARALSELDRFQFDTIQLAHAAHGGNLMSRIKRLLRPDVEPIGWKMVIPLLGLCAASAVMYVQAAPPAAAVAAVAAAVAAEPAPAAEAAPMAELAAPVAPAAPVDPVAPVGAVAPVGPVAPVGAAAPAGPVAAVGPVAPVEPVASSGPAARPAPKISVDGNPADVSFTGRTMLGTRHGGAYAVVPVDRERMTVAGSTGDLLTVADLRNTVKGAFVWFKDNEKSYVIEDPALYARAAAEWSAVDRIDAQLKAQGDQMHAQGKVIEAAAAKIGAEQARPQAATLDIERHARLIGAVAGQQAVIHEQLAQLALKAGGQPLDAEAIRQRAELQAQLAPLNQKMAEYQRDLTAHSEKLGHDVGRRMAEQTKPLAALSKPMGEMGARMGALGRERAQAQRNAELAMRTLFKEALKNGKAIPVTPSA
jgi:beta-lactamase regulating signal transducer with metallopeptidase domain